jgi:hypothetical protein
VGAENEPGVALAGDTALLRRDDHAGVGIYAVPIDASARAQRRLHVDTQLEDSPAVWLSGTPERAAIAIVHGDEDGTHFIGELFGGPPPGPWPALAPPVTGVKDAFVPIVPQLDGDRLFVLELRGDLGAERETVREGGGPPRVLETQRGDGVPAFAGDMEAVSAGKDAHTLVIRNWRTGAQRRVDLGDGAQAVDVRADGTAVVGFDGGGVSLIAPGGTPSVVSRRGEGPRFAGERIVYLDGERLMVVDPGAKPRPIGVPSASIEDFDADERHVLWTANRCLLVADLTAPAAEAPDPGVCARTEFEIDPHAVTLRIRRDGRVSIRVRCVAAPGACRGKLRVSAGSRRSAPRRVSMKPGERARLTLRLPRAALRGRGWKNLAVRAVLVDPDGRRTIVARGYGGVVR